MVKNIVYGDTSMKERMTINNPSEQTQKYDNLKKEHELLRSKYDNLILENSILSRMKEQAQTRVAFQFKYINIYFILKKSDESIEWDQKSNRSKTPTPSRDLNASLNNLKKDTKNLVYFRAINLIVFCVKKDECNRLKAENEELKRHKKSEPNNLDDYLRLLCLQSKTIEDL